MMLAGTPSEVNPNSSWLNARGMWASYCFGVFLMHLAFLSIPFVTVSWAWTLTNLIHNAVSSDTNNSSMIRFFLFLFCYLT